MILNKGKFVLKTAHSPRFMSQLFLLVDETMALWARIKTVMLFSYTSEGPFLNT